MYATMIACAFASCSKDDVIDNGPDAKGDASLTIKIDTKGTKAVGSGDATINELAVFLYKVDENGTKTLAGNQYVDSYTTDGMIVFNDLTAGDKYMCVGFANLGDVSVEQAAGTSPLGLTISSELYGSNDIPMHGVSGEVEIPTTSSVEAVIQLTRDLAKVELTAVSLNMNYTTDEGRFGDYTSGTAKFKFNAAYVNSAIQSGSYTYSNTGTYSYALPETPVYVGGLADWSWVKTAGSNALSNSAVVGYSVTGDASLAEATQTIGTPKADATEAEKAKYAAQSVAIPSANNESTVIFYVLPNENENKTTLTLEGTMQLINATTATQSNINNTVKGYYNITIGEDASVAEGFSYDGTGVHANDYFKISAIVVGTGSGKGGDKPSLVVKTQVKAWNAISQVTPVK